MARFAIALLFLAAVPARCVFAADAGLPQVSPGEVGLSESRLERLTQHMQAYVDQGELAGVVLAVARHGKLAYLSSLGQADIEQNVAMTSDTIFRIHSMTKPITSVAVMILVEEGRIKTTDPIGRYLPEFSDAKVFVGGTAEDPELEPSRRPITINHLLSHTPGMGGMGYETHPTARIFEAVAPFADNPTLETWASRLARVPLTRQPGEEFIYGPATTLLGRVVEVVAGMPFDEFLSRRIFQPLGMNDTYFVVPESKRSRFAVAYEMPTDGAELLPVTREDHEMRWKPVNRLRSGGGGLASTTADYLRFSQMLLNGGVLDGQRILAPKTVALMTTPVVHSADSEFLQIVAPGYGFGLGFAVLDDLAASGKPGSIGEYFWAGAADTYFFIDPQEQLIGLLMTQRYPAGQLQLREELQTLVYQALVE